MARLADFRGIHHGEAILVCGLGSSVRSLADPHRFRTIGVNDIERAFTPTYMFCMDAPRTFSADRLRYIQHSRAQFIFTDHDLGITRSNIVRFPIRRSEAPRLDDPDALYLIGRPVTSPFIAVCLAAHMGAKAIGLIGVDFTDGHFFAADGTHKLASQVAGIRSPILPVGKRIAESGGESLQPEHGEPAASLPAHRRGRIPGTAGERSNPLVDPARDTAVLFFVSSGGSEHQRTVSPDQHADSVLLSAERPRIARH
jgi:hypothetical protein